MTNDDRVTHCLHHTFGLEHFRDHQRETIDALLHHRDCFTVMPTGGGKSLCYQLPALLLPGFAVVVSPLISLMHDQVDAARAKGIPAVFLSADTSGDDKHRIFKDLYRGAYKLLYLSPERLSAPGFLDFMKKFPVSFFALDEAHCVTQWGKSFRETYLALSDIRKHFPDTPIGAWSATVTPDQQEEIIRLLNLRDPFICRASLNRPELHYGIRPKKQLNQQILAEIRRHPNECGIVYRFSCAETDKTALFLQKNRIRALPYHAKLPDEVRTRHQRLFMDGKTEVMVATVAFGMGIDKKAIRFIIHGDLPKSPEDYYQETGRAGRDGKPASCCLFYADNDFTKLRFLLEKSQLDPPALEEAVQKLAAMKRLVTQSGCLRQRLLAYFGEAAPPRCHQCDFCNGAVPTVNALSEAKLLLSLIGELKHNQKISYGERYLIDLLRGEKTEKTAARGHEMCPFFGCGASRSRRFWSRVTEALLEAGYVQASPNRYRTLTLTAKGNALLLGEAAFPPLFVSADASP